MNIFKGFAQIGPLADNTAGSVAPVGELSTMALTFTREKTLHTHSDFPGHTLVGFSYFVGSVRAQVTDPIAYECLKAISWIYSQSRLGAFTSQKDVFQQAFITQFGTTFDLVNSGLMKIYGSYFAPEWVEFCPKNQSATVRWKIWFSDESFFNQFDEYKIEVIPPIENIDLFWDDYNSVYDVLRTVKMSEVMQRATAVKGNDPETFMRIDSFEWTDRVNPTLKQATDWTTIGYGAQGNNLDAVKEAIRNYILANSSHDREEWATVFPDLFMSTEFIITPFWHKYSVPNQVRENGIYSGIVPALEAMELCHDTCKGVKYTNGHIDQKLNIVPSQYKSLMLAIVGGPENRDDIDTFELRYPDYMNVHTTHLDFMAMTEETRRFVMLLAEMLEAAESLTPSTSVPQGFNRLTRDGVVYLSTTFENFLYLVTTKYSVEELTAEPELPEAPEV